MKSIYTILVILIALPLHSQNKALEWPGDNKATREYTKKDEPALVKALIKWCDSKGLKEDAELLKKEKDVGLRLKAPLNLFPPIPSKSSNPFYKKAMADAKGYMREKSIAADMLKAENVAMAFAHPQSQTSANSKLMILMLDYFEASLNGKFKFEGQFEVAHPVRAFLTYSSVYPNLFPPSRKKLWMKTLEDEADRIYNLTSRWRNGQPLPVTNLDSNYMIAMMDYSVIFNNKKYAKRAKEACEKIGLNMLEDGAYRYNPIAMPVPHYHSVMTRNLTRYWLVSNDAHAKELLIRQAWYWPLTLSYDTSGHGYGDDSSTVTYKKAGPYNSAGRVGSSQYLISAISGIPEIASMWECKNSISRGESELPLLLAAAFYRKDLKKKELPEEFIAYDKNIMGPIGRFKGFSFSGSSRDSTFPWGNHGTFEGRDTYSGCIIVKGGQRTTINTIHAALRIRKGKHFHPTAARREYPDKATHSFHHLMEKATSTTLENVAALSGGHKITTAKQGNLHELATDAFSGQAWLYTPERMVGIVTIEPGKSKAYSASIALHSYGENMKQKGPDTWTQGHAEINFIDHNLYPKAQITEAWKGLELIDKESYEQKEQKMKSFKRNDKFHCLMEIKPKWSPKSSITNISQNDVLAFHVKESKNEYIIIANPTAKSQSYKFSFYKSATKAKVYKSGAKYRPEFMKSFVYDKLIYKRKEMGDAEQSPSSSNIPTSFRLPANSHYLIIVE